MKLTHSKSLLALGLFVASLLPIVAAEPDADQILQQMSAKLAAAQNFSFKATREIDAALLAGRNAPENAQQSVLPSGRQESHSAPLPNAESCGLLC